MAATVARWTALVFVCSRLPAVALFRNYGKSTPSARAPDVVRVPIVWRTLHRALFPDSRTDSSTDGRFSPVTVTADAYN